MRKLNFETLQIHAGYDVYEGKSVAVPIYQSVAYPFESAELAKRIFADEEFGFTYGRINNPTCDILEKRIASLEGGEAGLSTSSGMAAIFMVSIHLAKEGDEIVSSNRIYGGTHELFMVTLKKLGIDVKLVENPEEISNWEKKISSKTKFLYVESPSNPNLFVGDIPKLSELAHSYGIPLVVDNTICTPALQKPLQLGADIVIHSATKYLSGNSTVLGGLIVAKEEMIEQLRKGDFRNIGPSLSPFNAWLILLGMETLSLRMEKHSQNAMRVAEFLESHPKVEEVSYPGLKSHPQHQLAKIQMKAFSSLLSFKLKGGEREAFEFINSLRLIEHATHLGTSQTIVAHPASTTHGQLSEEEREKAGIPDSLIRMSIGLEDPDDLIKDLENALGKISS